MGDAELKNGDSVNVQDIVAQMTQIRASIGDDVDGIIRNTGTLTHWRNYVRSYPAACLGLAMALGYLVVPRRLEVVRPDAETMQTLAKKEKLVVTPKAEEQARNSLLGNAFTLASNALVRAGVAFLGQTAAQFIAKGRSGDELKNAVASQERN